ncbi:hypothetical protein COV20_00045 [Candidatus Woesearchaeota archaeon CG10_big_fil_rev_8_21_14_0_10_45_16]|nr:MAG: hypothetical protein COV20_00045 [Candidatus Woesearchaeota archaeon CG10_big_fil_rev_8_21_14_0_10_45_16]
MDYNLKPGHTVVVGAQWGDEGKGKLVDLLAAEADVVVRYQGGANAGHTLVVDGREVILHLIPSGAMNPRAYCVMAQGTVIDPSALKEEMDSLPGMGLEGRLLISEHASIVTPIELWADGNRESNGDGVGSTRKGIGPCYEDRAGRRAVRFGDMLFNPKHAQRMVEKQMKHWKYGDSAEEVFNYLREAVEMVRRQVTDTSDFLRPSIKSGNKLLFEGAQGALLDVMQGTYPNVTSSSTGPSGVYEGAGIPAGTPLPNNIGVVKAVMTRVGNGPFPTQLVDEEKQFGQVMGFVYQQARIDPQFFKNLLPDEQNSLRRRFATRYQLPDPYSFVMEHLSEAESFVEGRPTALDREDLDELTATLGTHPRRRLDHILGMYLQVAAGEYGATSGRPRKPGWLDGAALNHVVKQWGLTHLAVTKLDCLADIENLKIGTGYTVGGREQRHFPVFNLEEAEPRYIELPGFSRENVIGARTFEQLPSEAQGYIRKIEEIAGIPVFMVGVGPDREQTILRGKL